MYVIYQLRAKQAITNYILISGVSEQRSDNWRNPFGHIKTRTTQTGGPCFVLTNRHRRGSLLDIVRLVAKECAAFEYVRNDGGNILFVRIRRELANNRVYKLG